MTYTFAAGSAPVAAGTTASHRHRHRPTTAHFLGSRMVAPPGITSDDQGCRTSGWMLARRASEGIHVSPRWRVGLTFYRAIAPLTIGDRGCRTFGSPTTAADPAPGSARSPAPPAPTRPRA